MQPLIKKYRLFSEKILDKFLGIRYIVEKYRNPLLTEMTNG